MLTEQIAAIDRCQARRFDRLTDEARVIAAAGITRHLEACRRMGVEPGLDAIREIIDDAKEGRAVYAEVEWTPRRGVQGR